MLGLLFLFQKNEHHKYKISSLFFSHRKSSHENFPKEAKTGRHISVIGMVD